MTAGMTVVLDVDNVGDATATWDAAAATIVDTTTYAVTDQDGLTAIVTLTGGPYSGIAQTVTFSGATTTAASVASQMNSQLVGCSVAAGAQVTITHDGKGTGMDIAVAAGTGNLTWAASTAGTGDVVDISAVTAAEVKTVLEADTTALVTVTSGYFTIYSPTTGTTSELDFDATSTGLTALGLSAEVVVGLATSPVIGASVRDIGIAGTGTSNAVIYADTDAISILRDGYMYLALAGTGSPGDAIYFVNATGALGIGTATTGQTQLSNWSLESTIATTGAIGKVRVRA
jgi:hypothetical protein